MDFQELSDEDLSTWHMDLSRILSVLPSSDTLFFPSGAYKMNMNEPKVLLSMDEYESDLEHIGVSPNHMPAVDSQDDIALDVSAMVLSDLRAAFLSNTSFAESIRQGMPMAVSLYKLFGDIGLQIQAAIDAQQKGLQHFDSDEEAAWSEAESDEDEPLVRTDLPMAFEIQIRGVRRTPPCVVPLLPLPSCSVFGLCSRTIPANSAPRFYVFQKSSHCLRVGSSCLAWSQCRPRPNDQACTQDTVSVTPLARRCAACCKLAKWARRCQTLPNKELANSDYLQRRVHSVAFHAYFTAEAS